MRGAVCAICLLPPTLLMDPVAIARREATLPYPYGVFYGSNIAGVFARPLYLL
jgi:hypothetical protein